MTVLRVRTAATIARADIRDLVLRAVEATRYPGADPVLLYDELARRIAAPDLGFFVGFVGEWVPQALCVAILPTSQLMMAPQCVLVYSRGPSMLVRHIGERLRAWLRAEGYDRVMGVNLYRSDAAFLRAGRRYLGSGRRIGSLMEFTLCPAR